MHEIQEAHLVDYQIHFTGHWETSRVSRVVRLRIPCGGIRRTRTLA